jgi:hypothetical protein
MTSQAIDASVPHTYPLAVRDSGLFSAIGLLMRSLPYALARFAVLFTFSIACIVWLTVTMGGAAAAGKFIAPVFGVAWFVLCVAAAGWLWGAVLRYVLHLIACGHVAVLTELIVHGRVGNGNESMFVYGKRIVTERFGQVNALFAMNVLVRGVVNAVHRTIEGIGHLLPIPGLEAIGNLVTAILRAATRYMDKVLFSYNLACGDPNPWRSAQQGLVYYAQEAKPLLKQAVWIVVLEHVLSVVLWLALLVPAAFVTAMLPHNVRNLGGAVTIGIAALFALSARSAFLKPIFLIMVAVRFHALVEHAPINQEWVARLEQLSTKFRDLGQKAQAFVAPPAIQPAAASVPAPPPTA